MTLATRRAHLSLVFVNSFVFCLVLSCFMFVDVAEHIVVFVSNSIAYFTRTAPDRVLAYVSVTDASTFSQQWNDSQIHWMEQFIILMFGAAVVGLLAAEQRQRRIGNYTRTHLHINKTFPFMRKTQNEQRIALLTYFSLLVVGARQFVGRLLLLRLLHHHRNDDEEK